MACRPLSNFSRFKSRILEFRNQNIQARNDRTKYKSIDQSITNHFKLVVVQCRLSFLRFFINYSPTSWSVQCVNFVVRPDFRCPALVLLAWSAPFDPGASRHDWHFRVHFTNHNWLRLWLPMQNSTWIICFLNMNGAMYEWKWNAGLSGDTQLKSCLKMADCRSTRLMDFLRNRQASTKKNSKEDK